MTINIQIIITFAKIKNCNEIGRRMLNRIKIVLAEKDKTNKWLAEQLDKDPAMVSKWVTNKTQPSVETLIQKYWT